MINPPKAMTPPWCAVCDKRCERVEEAFDQFMRRVVFTACCHGERERVILTEEELNVLEGRVAIAAGIAFSGTRARLLK